MNKKVISSVLEKIDVFLTIALKGLFHWGLGIGLFLVGVSIIIFQVDLIFANSSGLADVSIVEFLFLVIMAGLIWRHWFYASKNSYSQFEMMLQTIINVGIVNVCLLALTSLAFYLIYAGGESLDKFMRTFYSADYLSELLAMASMIFIFYFSAPVEKNIAIETADSEIADAEIADSEQVEKNEYEPAERKQGYENDVKV